jgi:hypothetical protein
MNSKFNIEDELNILRKCIICPPASAPPASAPPAVEEIKVCLYGACGRHNFGDMLFPHIVTKLLSSYAVKEENIIVCDILDRDMRIYGGHNVSSITSLEYENITHAIMVGGEICGCHIDIAIYMFHPDKDENTFTKNKLLKKYLEKNCYVLNKKTFVNEKCVLIANSIGNLHNFQDDNLIDKLKNYTYVSTRDSFYKGHYDIVPDCAVLTKEFFNDKIMSYKNEIFFVDKKYIAIQCGQDYLDSSLIENIEQVSNYYKLPIYFFVAGIAKGHDSFHKYEELIIKINTTYGIHIFYETNIWKICCLIANSYITIGSSLHVRIIAFTYSKIRFTISTHKYASSKHYSFINKWDNISDSYISNIDLFDAIKSLTVDKINIYNNDDNINSAIHEYKSYSKKWLDFFKPLQN